MPDAMTTLLANVGLSDLERRLRDEAIDETTFLDLDDADLKEIGINVVREVKDRRTTPGADRARSRRRRRRRLQRRRKSAPPRNPRPA